MEIRNRTSFVAGMSVQLDKNGAEQLVVCVRGTWAISEAGNLQLMTEPPPLLVADEHWGEPGQSSVRYEADLGLMKPATDVALVGSAVALNGAARKMTVSFRAGPLKAETAVFGERRWLFSLLGGWTHTLAQEFSRVPLQWELAVGGTDATPEDEKHHSLDLRNPLGRGFRAKNSKLERSGSLLPQIEGPDSGLFGGDPAPAGFGFIGGHWLSRRQYAGTYDEAWRETRCPLLPLDFDERFHCSAAPGLTAPGYFEGGEPVETIGCTPSGYLSFTLPRVSLSVSATLGREPEPISMRLNTVTVDTDEMQLRMLWRGQLNVHKRFPKLKRIDVLEGRSET